MDSHNNSGDWNSGDWNSGDWNSGNWNSGDWNSGDRNSGNWNSGDWNSGDRNSGNWNSGDRNSGDWNTNEPKMRMFNKDTNITRTEFNNSDLYIHFYIETTKYIWYSHMTDEQKKEHDYAKTTGGALITYEYKEAWANWWEENKSDEMIARIKKLPNFDAEIFEEISGIDIDKDDVEEMTMEEVCKQLGKTIKIKK